MPPRRLLYEQLRSQSKVLADEFDKIYNEALNVWSQQYLPVYTIHGKKHTEQVERNLDNLTIQLQASEARLAPEEIFVLLSGCCLHDIGMQLIDNPRVREEHAENAYQLILYSEAWVGAEFRKVTLSISNDSARQAIAKIARGHWITHALPLDSEDTIYENIEGRLRLLALLLAMADLLDISPVRAHYFNSIHRLYTLPPVSELHQKMHKLVKSCRVMPPTKRGSYSSASSGTITRSRCAKCLIG